MGKKLREKRDIIFNSGVASVSGGDINGLVPEDEHNAETDASNHSDDLIFDGTGSDSSDSIGLEGEEELEDNVAWKMSSIRTTKTRSNITDKDLDTKDLFHTNMFQNKKIWAMTKILHTMKDATSFTKDNTDISIESKGASLNSADKMKK